MKSNKKKILPFTVCVLMNRRWSFCRCLHYGLNKDDKVEFLSYIHNFAMTDTKNLVNPLGYVDLKSQLTLGDIKKKDMASNREKTWEAKRNDMT